MHTISGRQNGFTYLSLLFMITVMGLAAGVAGKVWSTEAARQKEEELIFRGSQLRDAIARYYEESPVAKAYPKAFEDLVEDKRYPVAKRHLRKLYTDPLTGEFDWEPIKSPDGGIMGVKSSVQKEPLKKKGFPARLMGFEDRSRYSEWEFKYEPLPPAQNQTKAN